MRSAEGMGCPARRMPAARAGISGASSLPGATLPCAACPCPVHRESRHRALPGLLNPPPPPRLKKIQDLAPQDVEAALGKLPRDVSAGCVALLRRIFCIAPPARPSLNDIMVDAWWVGGRGGGPGASPRTVGRGLQPGQGGRAAGVSRGRWKGAAGQTHGGEGTRAALPASTSGKARCTPSCWLPLGAACSPGWWLAGAAALLPHPPRRGGSGGPCASIFAMCPPPQPPAGSASSCPTCPSWRWRSRGSSRAWRRSPPSCRWGRGPGRQRQG